MAYFCNDDAEYIYFFREYHAFAVVIFWLEKKLSILFFFALLHHAEILLYETRNAKVGVFLHENFRGSFLHTFCNELAALIDT